MNHQSSIQSNITQPESIAELGQSVIAMRQSVAGAIYD